MQEKKVRKMYIKPTILLIVIFVLLAILIGQIVAYFKDQESITNTFTIGNIEINLTEGPIWDAAYRNNTVPQIAQNLRPGDEVAKAPKVQNTGSNPAYVYMKVYVPRYVNGDLFTYDINEEDDEEETPGWIQREEVLHTDDGKYNIYIYEYSEELAAGSETTTLFDKVKLAGITPDEAAVIPQNQKIIIEAYAIQSENGINKASNEITTKMISKTGESISQKYTVTFDANGGILPDYANAQTGTKDVIYGLEYGNLPTPIRDGCSFTGWQSRNILSYKLLSSSAKSRGISVDNTGYISDSTPTSDDRPWNYANCNWHLNLESGTYTLTIEFDKQCTATSSGQLRIFTDNTTGAVGIIGNNNYISGIDKKSYTFNLSQTTNIGILIKGYDGIYRIQLEKGSTATDYEANFITESTIVSQQNNHTITAIWEPVPNSNP